MGMDKKNVLTQRMSWFKTLLSSKWWRKNKTRWTHKTEMYCQNIVFPTTSTLAVISVTMGEKFADVVLFETSKLKEKNIQIIIFTPPRSCKNTHLRCYSHTHILRNTNTHDDTHTHIFSHSLLYPCFQQLFLVQESVSGNKCFLDGSHFDTIEMK